VTKPTGDLVETLDHALKLQAEGRFDEAAALMRQVVDGGLARGHVHLGWMHQMGLGTPIDLSLAEKHYSTAAQVGDVQAEYYLASLLRSRGDSEGALHWYETASEHGHASAAYWAYVLHSDRGADASQKRARHYLEAAAERGHYFAQRDLARDGLRSTKSPLLMCKYLVAYVSAVARGTVAALRNAEQPSLH